MKTWKKLILIALVAWFALTMLVGFNTLTRVKITLGEAGPLSKEIMVGMARYVLDKSGTITIPLTLTVPATGCSEEMAYALNLSANIHVYCNTQTGESFFRLEEITYSITITKDGVVVKSINLDHPDESPQSE